MDLHATYPALSDLRSRAQSRLPKFVWEYLDSATGTEATKHRNRAALDRVGLMPSVLHGEFTPDLSVNLMGQKLPLPFGMSPLGMSGLIWPDAEAHLARAADRAGIPFGLSTVAATCPEDVAPHLGAHGWFQLYPPRDPEIRTDMLARAKAAGFTTLVLTVDVPVASRRERQTRSGLTSPPKLTPRLMAQVAMRPAWAMGMARRGLPHMKMLDKYTDGTATANLPPTAHVGYLLRTAPDWDYLHWLRDHWQGPLVIKGVLRPEDATKMEKAGADAIWVSNHAGRQFDAAPASAEALPAIRAATKLPVIFDSGVESGLDILRAFALGADFIMLGRAFHFALAALGPRGVDHLIDVLARDLTANMGQLGAQNLRDLPPPFDLSPL
ncbi:alpha-hydroxy-acid oxidizing protein [Sulfitobacter sp. KE34]|uniref:Alpha-hydroxy acid oxidase n=1 Tax=Sulfitobacter faviae TaxID=1775881 RepID=A0AAX3LLX5_9RHOB|nr:MULTISPECIES: alpha-hydroxy acid oxidase [Sulfitobacter]MDF3349080.1 alpha-hydroxy-acid oxidizing protein [Sulfitobacter sp. KE12]MDF3352751.1 alpha-hydroxy-acid oxidizing protein [Sulfitobacter sp. KE27]MDF3356398.1 alpha-hydroxy-acid oxidizing protein [Sulfitobacter sp. KE33]MDF3360827.1 alpha-hydroxy-acid oxidizing protein [Sulfitobacter sp. Ks41]MDF3363822.1 alpha-hydroxy-acid oxidizing protein [Sulfitobacter sp. Ks34]